MDVFNCVRFHPPPLYGVLSYHQSQDDADITYSTPNSEWDILATYEGGSTIEMDVVLTNHHYVSVYVVGLLLSCVLFSTALHNTTRSCFVRNVMSIYCHVINTTLVDNA